MSKHRSQSPLDKFFRVVLVVAAAVTFGLLLYWIAPDVTPYVGETGAALWSWCLIIASGAFAHRLLPAMNLAPVSRVLFAVLASAAVAMLVATILALFVLPVDQDEVPQVLLFVEFSALALASIAFVPLYLIRRKLGRAVRIAYLLTGLIMPSGYVMLWRPLGQHDFVLNVIFAGFLGLIGVFSAIGFAMAIAWSRSGAVAEQ